jgi:hypothetical protein
MSATGKFQQPVSGFSPLSFGGCSLWLDATSPANFILSGSNVTTWYDETGLSNHANSVNGGNPVLSNGAINGRAAVYFSNAPSIGGTLTLSNAAVTGFMVIRPLQLGTGRGDQRIFSAATSGAGDWNADSRFLIGPQGGTTEIRFNRGNTYIPRVNFNASNNYVVSWAYDGLSNYIYLNGADGDIAQGVALSNSAFNTTLYRLANQVAITSETYNGFIGEVIIYDDFLTPLQRQTVEGYLAWKWGIAPAPFSPLTSLTNCAVWFDGADASTFTLSGSNITQWRDKAGSNVTTNVGTPVYTSNAINGIPGVDMNVSSGFYVTPMSNAANTNTISVYGVLTPSNTSQNNARIFTVGRISDGTTNNDMSSSHLWTLFRVQTPGLYMQHNNNSIYVDGALPTGTPVLLSLIFDGGTATLRINGYSRGTLSTGNTLNFNRIGIFKNINPNAGSSYDSFAGQLGEFLIFYAGHTEAQRVQVESYLASKWGVGMRARDRLGLTHLFLQRPPFVREFQPIDLSSCALWLDAGDRSTLTLSASNTVTGWADKSGNRRTVTMSSGNGTYSSNGFQSLYPTVSFTTGQFMTVGLSSTLTNAFTVFVVHQITGTGFNFVFAAGASNSIFHSLFRDDFNTYQIGQDSAGSTGNWWYTTQTNRPLVESMVVKPTAPYWNQYLNGVRLVNPNIGGSGTPPLSNVGSSNVYIPGADTFRGGPSAARYQGQICEVIVYSNAFTNSQRQMVENYLANKWGLRSTMYGVQAHPFRYGPPVGVLPTSTPAPGCALWLDAADSSTLTLSGSNVTQWLDKSGNARHATPFQTGPVLSNNGLVFDATGVLQGTAPYLHSSYTGAWTLFTVFTASTTSIGNPRIVNYPGIAQMMYIEGGRLNSYLFSANFQSTGRVIASNTPYLAAIVNSASSIAQYVNGTLDTSSSHGALPTGSNTTYYVGGFDTGGSDRFRGTINEILCFSNALTASQRERVEGYLAAKWNLSSSLDVSHPYRSGPQSSIVPASLQGCQLWLDAQDSNAFTLSGSNVTSVLDKSPNAWGLGSAANATRGSTLFNGTYPSFYSTGSGLGTNGTITLTQPVTVYFVGQSLNTWGSAYLYDSTNTGAGRLAMYAGAYAFAGSGDLVPSNNGESLSPHVLSMVYNGASSSMILNSTTTTGNPGSQGLNGIIISKGDGYRGHICELLFFSGAHTTTQRQQMMGYLAWKWGIPFRLPGGSSNTAVLTRSLVSEFDPRSIGACGAWFDAADISTFQFSSGSNVSRWLDKSGLQNHAVTIAGTPTFTGNTLAGRPVLTFTGTQNMRSTYAPTTSTTPQTIIAVLRPSALSSNMTPVVLGPSGSYSNPPPRTGITVTNYSSYAWFLGATWGGYEGAYAAVASTSRTDVVVCTWYGGTNGNTSVNGTQSADSSATTPALAVKSTTGCLLIGATIDLGTNLTWTAFSGYIAEVLVYGKALTIAERHRIEGYLTSKWGLQSQLPASHPYSSVRFS